MPTKASAMPTEPIRMYFQEASTDARLRCSGTSTAEVIVVASIATHITADVVGGHRHQHREGEEAREEAEAARCGGGA